MSGALVASVGAWPLVGSRVECQDLRPHERGQTLLHLRMELARAEICAEKHWNSGNRQQYEAFSREIQALADRIDELDAGSAERSH